MKLFLIGKLENMDKKTCIKCCGKGGNVLVCRNSDCPVAVHESCMPNSLQVHDSQNFLCSYCLYKQSVAECRQAKKKALLAERNLALFLGAKRSVNQEGGPSITLDKETALQSKKRVNFQYTENEPNNGKCNLGHDRGLLSDELASTSTLGNRGGYLRNCKVARCSNGMKPVENQKNWDDQFCISPGSKGEGRVPAVEPGSVYKGKIKSVDCQLKVPVPLAVVDGEVADFDQPLCKDAYENQNFAENRQHPEPLDCCNMEKAMEFESFRYLGQRNQVGKLARKNLLKRKNKRHREAGSSLTAICSRREGYRVEIYDESNGVCETHTSCNEDRTEVYSRLGRHSIKKAIESKNYSPGKVSDEPSESEDCRWTDYNTVISSDIGWIDKPSKKFLDGASCQRRKRLRWTTAEEEMLKQGVLVFSSSVKKNLPWRKILEFGSHVFHQWRTPVDLQSKWKIMSRKDSLKSTET